MDNEQKNQNEEKYDLYTENIVTKPWVKYKKLIGFLLFLLAAVMFGVIVTMVVTLLYPRINEPSRETHRIVIEKDSYPYESQGQSAGQQSTEAVADNRDIKEIAADIKKSLVLIQVAKEDSTSRVNEESAQELFQSVTGIIIEIEDYGDGFEYYILTKAAYLDNAKKIGVKFNDGNVREASILGRHTATNMALLYVNCDNNSGVNHNVVVECPLGSSYGVAAGDDIIVMGKLQGNVEAFNFGRCGSNSAVKQLIDLNIGVLSTDVPNKLGDEGYIFDKNGKLIGIGIDSSNDTINAYGISDLKNVIEIIVNKRAMPYLGIYGTTVTDEIQMVYELPEGVYVSRIAMDSPAFRSGLQNGDVIIKINYAGVRTMNELTSGIFALHPEDKAVLTIMRKGNEDYRRLELTLSVEKLGETLE